MRLMALVLVCAVPVASLGSQALASKVVRVSLNQNEPALIKLGTRGITTLEFPYKIEALDGFGFSVSPSPDGADLFQISFNKGTNFLSMKAMREGVEGNLTVVLDGKVYCLFCTAVATQVLSWFSRTFPQRRFPVRETLSPKLSRFRPLDCSVFWIRSRPTRL